MIYRTKKQHARREKFLAEKEQVVPGAQFVAVIEPHCSGLGRRGRPPTPLESMARKYFMQ